MRIYKGSEITLRLYNPCKIEDGLVDVVLYTTNPKLAYKIKDATVEGNIVYVKIDKSTFNNMEDGVINYIILDEVYNTERQSSYYLKTPEDYVAKSVQSSKNIDIVDNGDYKILPDEDYSSIEEVNVHVEFDAEPYIQRGFELGEENQKSKLESVSITENGTYSREDGYNEIHVEVPDLNGDYQTGYDEGYEAGIDYASENAGEIAAQTARVLNITENGNYLSQYSDTIIFTPTITGKYPNGDNFYDYAYISKRGYNTGIFPSPTTRLEFWWRFDGTIEQSEGLIIGAQQWGKVGSIFKVAFGYSSSSLVASINDKTIYFPSPDTGWHHYTMSFKDGFFIDGEKIGDFVENLAETSTYEPICINGYYGNSRINADDFGMVIIDDTIFIPTANGWLNVNTNEYLPIVQDKSGDYLYTQVEPVYIEGTGNLIKTVNVDVQPKINVAETGLKFGYSTFTEVPEWADFSSVTKMDNMFNQCFQLQSIPELDTSNVVSMVNMLYNCSSLKTIPLLNTSNVTNMEGLFSQCSSLITIPQLDTSNVSNWNQVFYACRKLASVPALQADKLNMPETYRGIFGYSDLSNLTDFGGLIGLKCRLIGDYNFTKLPNLTYESCINILNGLYDFTGNGETPDSNQGQLKVAQSFIDKLTEEDLQIPVNKGWTLFV